MDKEETYNAVFNFMVDTLTDMADVSDVDDIEEVREDMSSIVSILLEGLAFEVVSIDGDFVVARVKVS